MPMNNNRWRRIMFFMSVMAIICASSPVSAQDEEDVQFSNQPTAYWHVNIDEVGKTTSNFTVMFEEDTPDLSDLRPEFIEALQAALHCTLDSDPPASKRYGLRIYAECVLPIQKSGLVVSAAINPGAVKRALDNYGPFNIDLTITVPELGFSSVGKGGKIHSYGTETVHSLFFRTTDRNIDELPLEFGYNSNYVPALLTISALLLIAQIMLILFIRRRSLILAGKDATAAWFGYWRVHRWIVEGGWVIWIITLSTFGINSFIRYLTGSEQPVLNVLILFLPPVLVTFLSQFLARPLWAQVRGINWNKREMLVRGVWEHVAAILPMALLIVGIGSLFQETGTALFWFAAAVLAQPVAGWMHGRISGITPRPLHSGEFRDNTLSMAHRAGVKIKQILLMPAKHLQMGNAFAMQGHRIMVTDFLLERMTKQETDCVMAHEIGHVKMRHGLLLSWLGTLLLFGAFNLIVGLLALWPLFVASDSVPMDGWFDEYLRFPLALLLTLLTRYFLSRRFEHSADEFATLVTGAPEAMITALVKLTKMNLMPVSWGNLDEQLSTHPSTVRRVKAIADRHRIPANRLEALLATLAMRGEGDGYTVAEEATSAVRAVEPAADFIEIACPCCAFSRSVPLRNLPDRPVKATCPKCAQSFSVNQHMGLAPGVKAQTTPPPPGGNENATSMPSPSRDVGADKDLLKTSIAKVVPLAVTLLTFACGAPWYIAVPVFLLAPYWYGPFLIYHNQRMPTLQPLRDVSNATHLPFEHQLFLDRMIPVLEGAGFAQKGCFTSAVSNTPICGTVTLLQHQKTSDIVHLLVSSGNGQSAELLGFSRSRADGSRLTTGWSNLPSALSPPAQDNTLRVAGNIEPMDLWRVHQARVVNDPKVIRNEAIEDALGYQVKMEQEMIRARIASRMWKPAGQSEYIRPTAMGALLMSLRMLFPWKYFNYIRGKMVMRRHLNKSGVPGAVHA